MLAALLSHVNKAIFASTALACLQLGLQATRTVAMLRIRLVLATMSTVNAIQGINA